MDGYLSSLLFLINAILLLLQVNQVDGYGRMALHYAAERDVFCVEILLQYGADINVGDGNHDSPLHWAAYKDNVACVKLLLQHGAEVDVRDYNLDTPLSWAAKRGHLEVIKILLEYNADVHWKNLNGDTPLIRAATVHAMGLGTSLDDACLEILIRAAGQFELRDNDGALVRGIGQDNKMNDLLMPLCRNPRKLTDVCRCKIRTCLGHRYLPNVTPKLPIPLSLKEHILLQR